MTPELLLLQLKQQQQPTAIKRLQLFQLLQVFQVFQFEMVLLDFRLSLEELQLFRSLHQAQQFQLELIGLIVLFIIDFKVLTINFARSAFKIFQVHHSKHSQFQLLQWLIQSQPILQQLINCFRFNQALSILPILPLISVIHQLVIILSNLRLQQLLLIQFLHSMFKLVFQQFQQFLFSHLLLIIFIYPHLIKLYLLPFQFLELKVVMNSRLLLSLIENHPLPQFFFQELLRLFQFTTL